MAIRDKGHNSAPTKRNGRHGVLSTGRYAAPVSDRVGLSRLLSYLLRHRPEKAGLALDAEGWVDVGELLGGLARLHRPTTFDELAEAVATNDKRRFAFSADRKRLRASQGHSVAVDLGLGPTAPPALLFHGTVVRFVPRILEGGLVKGRRRHVHLSASRETARRVGARRGEPVLLAVRAAACAASGHEFFLSANGVWLTERVPPEFLAVDAEEGASGRAPVGDGEDPLRNR